MSFRKTTQSLAPLLHPSLAPGQYDIYPGFPLGPGKIISGFDSLAETIISSRQQIILIDGYAGVLWDSFRASLDSVLRQRGLKASWQSTDEALESSSLIEKKIQPFLGGDDPLFGTRCNLQLMDFFDEEKLQALASTRNAGPVIFWGCGAALTSSATTIPRNRLSANRRTSSASRFACLSMAMRNPLRPTAKTWRKRMPAF
ncbi:MAG: hypothetical protein ABI623_01465 [bacterium]